MKNTDPFQSINNRIIIIRVVASLCISLLGITSCTHEPQESQRFTELQHDINSLQVRIDTLNVESNPEVIKIVGNDQTIPDTTSAKEDKIKNFSVKEDFISFGTDFHLESNEKSLGTVKERVLSWGRTFEWIDPSGKKIAKAKQSVFSWGNEIKIYDENDLVIGKLNEEILESIFSIETIYTLSDMSGNKWKSKKLDFIGTDIDIYSNGTKAVVMDRAIFSLTDSWEIEIRKDEIDIRLLVFVPCYKTCADNDREDEEDNKKKK